MLFDDGAKWPIIILALGMTFLAACAPSQPYRLGQGFYSEDFSPAQVRSAMKAGKVTPVQTFSFEASSCGNYTTGLADEHLVHDTLRHELPKIGANAAEQVTATEPLGNFLISLLVLPMGCSDWTISGQALLVDLPAPAPPPQAH
jgi:hypothetical protein